MLICAKIYNMNESEFNPDVRQHHEPQPLGEVLHEYLDEVERAYILREKAQELLDDQVLLLRKIEQGVPESSKDADRLTEINDTLLRMFQDSPETPHNPDE